jgi:iron complex transport system substrate-binding protein
MRVVTLVPAATEIVAALGGAGHLVGISHECDYPASVLGLPRVTATPIDPEAPGATIDAEVRRLQGAGKPVIGVDAAALRRLAPDLIIAQELCEVCAVAAGEVHRLAAVLEPAPRVLSLSGTTLEGIWADIGAVGGALDLAPEADELVAGLRSRLNRLRARRPPVRPRVACVEWLEPLYLAGHWVPELVEAAGGEHVGAVAGAPSARWEWSRLEALRPDLLVIMLCGFGVERTVAELAALQSPEAASALGAAPVWIIDGNAFTSRPGPRVVDGAELLQGALVGREGRGMVRWPGPASQ